MFGRPSLSLVRRPNAPRRRRQALQNLEVLESRVVLSTVAINSANTYMIQQSGISNAFPKFVDLEGNATGPTTDPTKFAEYDIADFNFSGLVGNAQSITGGTLTLTEGDTSFSKSGPFDIYVVADQTALTRGSTTTLKASPTTNTAIASTDFTNRQLLGVFNFPDTSGTSSTPVADTFTFTLSPSSAAAQLLLAQANSGTHNVRLAFTPDNAATSPSPGNLTAATWYGSGATGTSGQNPPNLALTVNGNNTPPLSVSSITGTATGFTAQFTSAIDPASVILYNTAATTASRPVDVTLTDSSGDVIPGSAVVSTNGQTLTFVATQGVLPNDTYTVSLTSGSKGIRGTNGQLAGNGTTPGTNYSGTFTENVTAPVVFLPSFATGPNQSVNLVGPTTFTTRDNLPVVISNGAGVTGVTATITYDPTLLTITGAVAGANAPAGTTVSVKTQTLATNVATATITYVSPTPLAAGQDEFLQLQAQVPFNATYQAAQALTVSAVQTTTQTSGSHTGTTTASSTQTTLIKTTGPGAHQYIDIEGNSTGNFAEYSIADFNLAGQLGNVTSLTSAVLSLTESNAAFSAPGTYDVYITQQTSAALTGVSYDPSTASGVASTNFADKVLVGSFAFTQSGAGGNGTVDQITFNGAGLTALRNSINNNGGAVRLLLTPDNATSPSVAATYAGQTAGTFAPPSLAITGTSGASSTTQAGTGSQAFEEVAYVGDTDADQFYSANDAATIRRLAVGLDSGFTAYPTTDPTLIADVDGDTTISANDAALVRQAAAGLTGPSVPTIPNPAAQVVASNSSIIQSGGPRAAGTGTANNNTTFFNIEGNGNGANADYAIADFNFTGTAAQGSTPSSLQFTLTQDNASFTTGGTFDVYVTGNTTVDINNDGGSPLFYDSTTATGIAAGQFTDRVLIGAFTFTQGVSGQTDFFTATNLSQQAQDLLTSDLASGTVRLLFTPDNTNTPGVAATYAGATPPAGFAAPSLQINT